MDLLQVGVAMLTRSEKELKENVIKAAKNAASCPLILLAEATEELWTAVEELERFEKDHLIETEDEGD